MTTRSLQDIRDEIEKLEGHLSDLEKHAESTADYEKIQNIVRDELNPLIDEMLEREEAEEAKRETGNGEGAPIPRILDRARVGRQLFNIRLGNVRAVERLCLG